MPGMVGDIGTFGNAMTSVAASTAGTSATLYDRQRDLYYAKPRLRGWQHLVWFVLSLVLAPITLAHAHGALRLSALAIYSATVTMLFGTSALYHRGNWTGAARVWLQRLDHVAIYLLIAGTATPVFLITTHGAARSGAIVAIAVLSATAIALHLAWMNAPEALVGWTFAGLGLMAGLALPAVWMEAGIAAAVLILVGGLLYLIGALSFYRRRPDPSPGVFGYHEVFHAYVCAAAACQYVAVVVLIA
jgi:hemolysin III